MVNAADVDSLFKITIVSPQVPWYEEKQERAAVNSIQNETLDLLLYICKSAVLI